MALSTLLYAKEKPKAGVLNFKGSGTSEAVTNTVRSVFEAKLFETDVYSLVDRSEIESIMQEQGLQNSGLTDNTKAVKIGKIANIDKIIIGSIDKLDGNIYNIQVKIINVETAQIDGMYTETANGDKEIIDTITTIIRQIENDMAGDMYSRFMSFGFSTNVLYFQPVGSLREFMSYGYGGSINLYLNNFIIKNVSLNISAEFMKYISKRKYINSMKSATPEIFIGNIFQPAKRFSINTYFGAGAFVNIIDWDSDGTKNSKGYQFNMDYFVQPSASIKIEFDYAVSSFLHIIAVPEYKIFYETENIGQLAGGYAGLKIFL